MNVRYRILYHFVFADLKPFFPIIIITQQRAVYKNHEKSINFFSFS